MLYRYRFAPPLFEYVSPTSLSLLGYSPDEFYADPEFGIKIAHPDDRPILQALFEHPELFENAPLFRWIRKDGRDIWLEPQNTLIRDEPGCIVAVEGVVRDVTTRRRSEGQLARTHREAEQRAAETEAVFASLNDAVLIYDTGMNVVRANPSFRATYKFDPMGLNVKDIIQRVSCRRLDGGPLRLEDQPTPRALRGEKVAGARFLITPPDGAEMIVETSSAPLRVGDHIVGSVTVWHDITELERTAEKLEESKRLLDALMEFVPEGITVADAPDARIRMVSRFGQEILDRHDAGLIASEVTARWKVYHKDGVTAMMDADLPLMRAILKGEMLRNEELVQVNANGKHLVLSCNAAPIRDRNQTIIGGIVAWRDITELKQAEESIQSLAKFPSENPNPVMRIGRDGTLLYANEASHSLLRGWQLEIGKPAPAILQKATSEAFAGQAGITFYQQSCQRVISLFVTPVPNAKYANIYGRDVTERKRAEAEREELLQREQAARFEAEAAVHIRDQFIALASHELKTPLTSLKGYAELLMQRAAAAGLTEQNTRMVRTIHQQALRLDQMVSGLLDITRIERGQLVIERAPVDLEALVTPIVQDIEPTLRGHTLELIPSRERMIVEGDEMRLEQVLQNLIQNAIKYSPSGGHISVRLSDEQGMARIAVSDQGIGIPTGALPQLFTRFYRAENAEAHHITGLGLGLYVAREIVRLHGGDITVTSEEGKGSEFIISLPLRRESSALRN